MSKAERNSHRPPKEHLLTTVRRAMLSQAAGDVIEFCGGSGKSLLFYPLERITSLTIVDRRFSAGVRDFDFGQVPATFVTHVRERLPLDNCCYDYGCLFFALSCMKEPYFALSELRRLLRPGGRVLFMEFYRPSGPTGLVYDGANLVRRVTTRGSIRRDIVTMLEVSGFQIETVAQCGHVYVYGSAVKL